MVQYARPDADTAVGNWSASSGTDRYAMIDEATTDDTDYISVTDDMMGTSEEITLSLSGVTDPVSSTGHQVTVRADEDGFMGTDLNVQLKDGATEIKNETFTTSSTKTNHVMTLNATQANNISDYSDLTLVLTATDSGASMVTTSVFQAFFECPDAPAAGSATPMALNTYQQMRNN